MRKSLCKRDKKFGMPSLIGAAFVGKSNKPFVWTCSDCNAAFSLQRMTSSPTDGELFEVRKQFLRHCESMHSGTRCKVQTSRPRKSKCCAEMKRLGARGQ